MEREAMSTVEENNQYLRVLCQEVNELKEELRELKVAVNEMAAQLFRARNEDPRWLARGRGGRDNRYNTQG